MDQLNTAFRLLYQPSRALSVDECMVPFKGRIYFKQYIKNKPHKWGIKLWALAESCTGYIQAVDVYSGRSDRGVASLSETVVISLLIIAGLCRQGYYLFMDNFFSSTSLFMKLSVDHLTYACGTVRLGRRELPTSVVSKSPVGLGHDRGSSVYAQLLSLLCLAWRDRKIVYLLSTIHTNVTDKVQRTVRENGRFTRVPIDCPVAIQDYTKNMGGVDRADQYAQYYIGDRKTRKWNVKLLFYLFEIAKTNAWILFKARHPRMKISLLQFSMRMIEELLATDVPQKRRGRPSLNDRPSRLTDRCLPGTFPKPSTCAVCAKRFRAGKIPKLHQTTYGCLTCGKHLCLPRCFTQYHTLENVC